LSLPASGAGALTDSRPQHISSGLFAGLLATGQTQISNFR